jgi:hypothetical protein
MPDYYVIADGFKNPAGHRIWKDPQGERRLTLSPAQAQYWIDQGAISDKPLASHSIHGRHVLAQMTGGHAPVPKAMAKRLAAEAKDAKHAAKHPDHDEAAPEHPSSGVARGETKPGLFGGRR